MGELRIASNFRSHPKFIELTRLAASIGIDLWLSMMAFCNQNLTDGIISVEQTRCLAGPQGRWRVRALRALLDVGLVEQLDELTLRMHDYLDWNPPAATVLAKRRERNQNRPTRSGPGGRDTAETWATRAQRHGRDIGNACAETTIQQVKLKDDEQLSLEGMALSRAGASSSSSSSSSDPDPPHPPDAATEAEPEPLEKKSCQPDRARRSIRSRCPADFEPDASTQAKATSLGFSAQLEKSTREEFIDYWIGEGELKSDWQATYRNRLRVVADKRGLKPPVHDEQWRRHQSALRKANEPVKVDSPPADVKERIAGVRSLFG